MKKILREVSSIARKVGGGVIVLPGVNSDFLAQLLGELNDFLLVTRDRDLASKKSDRVVEDFNGGRGKYLVDLSYLLETGNFKLPKDALCIVEAPNRSLVLRNKLLKVYHSEELMKERYLRPFKVIRYSPSRRLSQSRAFKERVERIKEIYESFNGFTVVAPNSKERDMLEELGIRAVTDLREVKDNRVILAKEIDSIPAYLYLRNKLWGGVLVDLSDTTKVHEEWEEVRLGELGFYKLNKRDFTGYETDQLGSAKGFSLKFEGEFSVLPRGKITSVKFVNGEILLGDKMLGKVEFTRRRINLKLNCRDEVIYSSTKLTLGYFLFPQSSGKCSLFTACMEREKNRELCLRASFEAYLLLRNYLGKLREIDLKKAVSSLITDEVVKGATRGKEKVELKLLDLSYVFELSKEANYVTVVCLTCNKKLKVRTRADIESTRHVLVNAIYGILKTELL